MGRSKAYKKRATDDNQQDSSEQKRHKHDGEYPPPPVLESEAFESYYRECGVVPPDEWEQFIGTLRQPLGISFRVTGHPGDPATLALREYMERHYLSQLDDLVLDGEAVPRPYHITWFPGRMAWRFDVSRSVLRGKGALKGNDSPAAKKLAAFHNFLMRETELGLISRQEEVSMVPPCLLDVRPGQVVVDLCAAPGSKTQQLIEAISPPGHAQGSHPGPSGLVVANDMDYRRCHLLVHQAKRLNSPALIVTNHDATMLPTKMTAAPRLAVGGADGVAIGPGDRSLRFDRILCDVPCSGDGTLRKAPDLWRRWTDGLGLGVHRMQLSILLRGLQMLLPGGRLVYSTCSMNPIEDEAVIAAALLELGTDSYSLVDVSDQLPQLQRNHAISRWRVRIENTWYDAYDAVPDQLRRARKVLPTMFAPPSEQLESLHLSRAMRVLPHLQNTGGFFIAVFERASHVAPPPSVGTEGGAASCSSAANAACAGDAASRSAALATKSGACDSRSHCDVPTNSGATQPTDDARGDTASAPTLLSHIAEQKGKQPAGKHVLRPLHLSPRNNGKYDALYELTGEWHEEVGRFLGLPHDFPYQQLVTRSVTGKAIYFVGAAALRLLRSDGHAKLNLVNTGTRVFDRMDSHKVAGPFAFQLAQEGVAFLAPYMGRQRVFIPTQDVLQLLRRRMMPVEAFASEAARAQLLDADPGGLAVVHDVDSQATLRLGQPMPLILAAVRTNASPPCIQLVIGQQEALSLHSRTANLPPIGDDGPSQAESDDTYRVLGKTGFKVSTVGYGCWQLGGCWSGASDKAGHKAALHAYLDRGGNLLDTANVYGGDAGTPEFGWSETLIGEVLKERRGKVGERIYVCTKAGRAPTDAAPGEHGPERYTYEALSQSVAGSAARLGVECIDLLQLHCPPPSVLDDGSPTYLALRRLQSEGRILHWGASVETVEEAMLAIAQPDCATIQIIFNLLRPRPAQSFLATAKARNVGTLIRLPFASGLLTGKVNQAYIENLSETDHRRFNVSGAAFDKGETWSGLGEHLADVALPAVEELKAVFQSAVERKELPETATFAQFSLKWILEHAGTTAVIPGARNIEQVESNLGAPQLPSLSMKALMDAAGVYARRVHKTVGAERW